jgi:hypothetical protein
MLFPAAETNMTDFDFDQNPDDSSAAVGDILLHRDFLVR